MTLLTAKTKRIEKEMSRLNRLFLTFEQAERRISIRARIKLLEEALK